MLNLGGRGRRGFLVGEKSMKKTQSLCTVSLEAMSRKAADREARERRSRSQGNPEVIFRDFILSCAMESHQSDLSKALMCLWSGSELVGTCESQ